jgi:hypothetical protein
MATRTTPRSLISRITAALPSLPRREPTVEDHMDVPEPELCPDHCDGTEVIGPSIERIAHEHGGDLDWLRVQLAPINPDAVVTVCDECNGIAGVLALGD